MSSLIKKNPERSSHWIQVGVFSWLIVMMTKILIKPNSDARTIVNDKSLGKRNDFIPLKSRRKQDLPVVLPESLKLRNAQLVW